MDDSDIVTIFLHIPKTAGNSVYHIMRRAYPDKCRYELDMDWDRRQESIDQFIELGPDKKKYIRYIGGHTFFGIHQYFQSKCQYMTFLRSPVDRFVSHYYFIKESPFHLIKDRLTNIKDPSKYQKRALDFMILSEKWRNNIEDFLDFCTDINVMNLQTTMIGGFIDSKDITPPYQQPPSNALDVCMNNIETHFPIIGTVERFNESLLLMQDHYSWRNIAYAKHNLTSSRPSIREIPNRIIDKIEQASQIDIDLYDYSSKILDKRIQQQDDIFESRLASLDKQVRLYSKLNGIYAASGLKSLISIFR